MDFFQIEQKRNAKTGEIDIYPTFRVDRSKDLMVRGKSFYAIWDDERQLWSSDEYDVQKLVDKALYEYAKKLQEKHENVNVKSMLNFSSNMWKQYRNFIGQISDSSHQLDENITFLNTKTKKTDYVSRRLSYSLEKGSIDAYDEIMSTLYLPKEREKLEWAIGAIISGDAKFIQKFIVLYGTAGSGKSTFLNIVQKLFPGYYTTFEAKALTGSNNTFSTEQFKSNPLIAIQHDGDLSRIEDNTKLNSIVSHEEMSMRELYKPSYTARSNAFLFMGTNKPVKITDSKSGIPRRLIDVKPSGNRIPTDRYHSLMGMIDFELGAICWHCLEVYKRMGKNYYSTYIPVDMMYQTDIFFNFIQENYYVFKSLEGISLSQAYEMYKVFCDESLVEFKLPRHKFREELKSYFEKFEDITRVEGKQVRSYYSGFIVDKFITKEDSAISNEMSCSFVLDKEVSILDDILADAPAQYATEKEIPENKWVNVQTKLSDLDTKRLHYVKPPSNHIVIDFDLKDSTGNKSSGLNLEAASKWPNTYAEFSKSGTGIHLHYIYDGDVKQLERVYSDGIEIKVFIGNSSLRRKFTKCNSLLIATISSGLPLKEKGDKMIDFDAVKSEQGIRKMIERNLNKDIHPGTKPSIDFIYKILDDAYKSGLKYDVTDMRQRVLVFANNSTNQSEYCVKMVGKMKWASEEENESKEEYRDDDLVFFDVEVYPNLFVVVWKKENGQKVSMVNPTPKEIESLLRMKLVGFNNRRYDNHILYARYIGYDNIQLYELSQKIINNSRSGLFGEAYNLSYTDVYDFSSKKQSLKKFQIELGLHHMEMGIPWDKPVPEESWPKVVEYCGNDVDTTEATFYARKQDFVARLILSDLSGLTPNDTTQTHAAKIIFGNDRRPQDKFIYTDLSEMFPGYIFENGKSMYRGEETGEGGYVYAEPGMYSNVAILDITSMHPRSIINMNLFGPYTKNFEDIVDGRVDIKHGDYETAKKRLNGVLVKYLSGDSDTEELAYALKIIINIVYGLTSAKFENKFKDPRNKDNIVAKRGALFMIDLKNACREKGIKVIHIKTDSIKLFASPENIQFVTEFGKKYGYTFEHEATFDRFCLLNDAVYVGKYSWHSKSKKIGKWDSTGAQLIHPYVFKTLFSGEPIVYEDMIEAKTVTSALYLDMNEFLNEDEHNYVFVGKAGAFCPVKSGCGGGLLYREKDGKYYAATGSKGYRWLESEMIKILGREEDINKSYYDKLVDQTVKDISKYGDFDWFVSDSSEYPQPCNKDICSDCSNYLNCEHLPF